MPVIYHDSSTKTLGKFVALKGESVKQNKIGRPPNYSLIGAIAEEHPLKPIINEMQDVTAPFEERIREAVNNKGETFIPNTKYYIVAKGDNVLVYAIAIIKLAENKSRIGFSCYSAELELEQDYVILKKDLEQCDVLIKNQLQQLDFVKGSAVKIKKSEAHNPSLEKPFAIMVQLHQYMTTGAIADLKSHKSFTETQRQALAHSLAHEIKIASESTDIAYKKLFKKHFLEILSFMPKIVGLLDKETFNKTEQALLKDCYDQFCIKSGWDLVRSAGLDKKYSNEKHNLRYILSNFISFILPLAAVLNLHMMHYCVVYLPPLFAVTLGISLAPNYAMFAAAMLSLATILLCYRCLQYLAGIIVWGLYKNDYYISYRKFCYDTNFFMALSGFARSLNVMLSEQFQNHFRLDHGQDIKEIIDLKDLMFQYSWMQAAQSAMLIASFLCLLLPSFQLVCGIATLLCYAAFSYSFVVPKKTEIIRANSGAMPDSSLFKPNDSAARSYDNAAESLGYNDVLTRP